MGMLPQQGRPQIKRHAGVVELMFMGIGEVGTAVEEEEKGKKGERSLVASLFNLSSRLEGQLVGMECCTLLPHLWPPAALRLSSNLFITVNTCKILSPLSSFFFTFLVSVYFTWEVLFVKIYRLWWNMDLHVMFSSFHDDYYLRFRKSIGAAIPQWLNP